MRYFVGLRRAVEKLLGVVASHLPIIQLTQQWFFRAAALGRVRAALVESAARWRVQRVGQFADDFDFQKQDQKIAAFRSSYRELALNQS